MNKSYRKGFTLVELLAVIVILAIILVIAVPKIMSVITDSKRTSLETSAKMIASAAEKMKLQNKLLGKQDEEITCDSVANLSNNDYTNCSITFDSNNNAIVNINGKGKFEGLSVCDATKNNASVSNNKCATPGTYFTYEILFDEDDIGILEVKDDNKLRAYISQEYNYGKDIDDESYNTTKNMLFESCSSSEYSNSCKKFIPHTDYEKAGINIEWGKYVGYEVKDVNKCANYLVNAVCSMVEEIDIDECKEMEDILDAAKAICNNESEEENIEDLVGEIIPLEDIESAGLEITFQKSDISITGYNIKGGTDVVIPSTIDGYKVTEIGDITFYNMNLNSVVIPETVSKIGTFSFMDNNITNISFPSNNITISDTTFYNNPSIKYPSNITVYNTNNSFAKDNWQEVKTNAYTKYNLGDRKPITVGEYGNHIVRISNTTPCSSVSTEGMTACGFVIEFEDIITKHELDDSRDWGPFLGTTMVGYLNTDISGIYNSLPTELKEQIINTKVVSTNVASTDSSDLIFEDLKLYLLSYEEVAGYNESEAKNDASMGTSRQLDYYSNLSVDNGSTYLIKKYYGIDSDWWLRATYIETTVHNTGNAGIDGEVKSTSLLGVSPAFRLAE